MIIRRLLITLLLIILLVACKNRLKPELFQIAESSQIALKEISSIYKSGYVLIDDPELSYLKSGRGNVLISDQSGPPGRDIKVMGNVFSIDENIEYRIYVNLPFDLIENSFDIANNSICRLMGRYDLEESARVYDCNSGTISIDSLKTSSFRCYLDAIYVNSLNDTLMFKGDIKAGRED